MGRVKLPMIFTFLSQHKLRKKEKTERVIQVKLELGTKHCVKVEC